MAHQYDGFIGSERSGTLAVELEAIFVRPDTMIPIAVEDDPLCATEIISWINKQGVVVADSEWRMDTVEVRTPTYWSSAREAKMGIFYLYDQLMRAADHFGIMMVPVASYSRPRAHICREPAYLRIWNRYPSVRHGANYFGMHVHYGVRDLSEKTFRALRRLNTVSGFILALAANAPCPEYKWASKRMIHFMELPGVSYYNWQDRKEYEAFINNRLSEGTIEQRSRFWAINRLGNHTIESRVTDLPGLVREAWTVLGLHAALISLFLDNGDKELRELSHFICLRNTELAAGHGLGRPSEEFWNPFAGGELTGLRQVFADIAAYVERRMRELGWGDEFDYFRQMVETGDNGATRIERWWSTGHDHRKAASALLRRELEELRP